MWDVTAATLTLPSSGDGNRNDLLRKHTAGSLGLCFRSLFERIMAIKEIGPGFKIEI